MPAASDQFLFLASRIFSTYPSVTVRLLLLAGACSVGASFSGSDAHLLLPRPGMLIERWSEGLRLTACVGIKSKKPYMGELKILYLESKNVVRRDCEVKGSLWRW